MSKKIKTLITGFVVAGSLFTAAVPVMARDYWRWSPPERRWDRRADLRRDYRDLAQARRQLEYDHAHHAGRHRLATDIGRIQEIENDIRADRYALRYWRG